MEYNPERIERRIARKNRRKKTLRILIYILIIPIIIYNTTLIIKSVVKRDTTPSFLGVKSFVIISGSMEPTLQIGDIVIVKENPKDEIKVGDIISFRNGNSIITHRVEEVINEEGTVKYKTKGDNNNVEDVTPINLEDVEGVYITKISKVGNIVLTLNNKTVIIILFIFLYIIYSINARKERKSRLRREKRENYCKEDENEKKEQL